MDNIIDWREIVKDIKVQSEEYQEYSSVMTAYERSVIEREIHEMVDGNWSIIETGLLELINDQLNKVIKAHLMYKDAAENWLLVIKEVTDILVLLGKGDPTNASAINKIAFAIKRGKDYAP